MVRQAFGVIVFLAWICTGLASTWWQLAQSPPAIEKGVRADFTGVVARVDGRIDERLRIWLRVEEASRRQEVLEGHLVRLSVQPDELAPVTGSRLRLTARIYPPPPPVMHGARDHGVQARVRNVVASGYVAAILSGSAAQTNEIAAACRRPPAWSKARGKPLSPSFLNAGSCSMSWPWPVVSSWLRHGPMPVSSQCWLPHRRAC